MKKLYLLVIIFILQFTNVMADVQVIINVPEYKRPFGFVIKGKKTTRISFAVPVCLGHLAFDIEDGNIYTVNSDQNCVMRVTYRKLSDIH